MVYGLSKVVYPLLKREFNRNCPDEVLDKTRFDIYERQTENDENKSRKKRMYLTQKQQQLCSPKGQIIIINTQYRLSFVNEYLCLCLLTMSNKSIFKYQTVFFC